VVNALCCVWCDLLDCWIKEMECLNRLMMDHPVFGVVGGSVGSGVADGVTASPYLQHCDAR
jgi:hypothetical protein